MHQHVGHGDLRSVLRMGDLKPLEFDLAAEFLKILGKQLLLGLHAGRAAAARSDGAELLEIIVRPRAVEGDVLQLQRRDGGILAVVGTGTAEENERRQHGRAEQNRGGEQEASAPGGFGFLTERYPIHCHICVHDYF